VSSITSSLLKKTKSSGLFSDGTVAWVKTSKLSFSGVDARIGELKREPSYCSSNHLKKKEPPDNFPMSDIMTFPVERLFNYFPFF